MSPPVLPGSMTPVLVLVVAPLSKPPEGPRPIRFRALSRLFQLLSSSWVPAIPPTGRTPPRVVFILDDGNSNCHQPYLVSSCRSLRGEPRHRSLTLLTQGQAQFLFPIHHIVRRGA
ncbi:hypothetical protein LZ31DRAFT_553103 [Colletotrichum somersetense]|nr:hypothetical protein LZ31DRAFT_553103 [Colletotrichum somersetense]